MADWPTAEDVKQVLDITSDDWDDRVDVVLSASIARVKRDVGVWDDLVDTPDEALSQAALRMAEMISERPGQPVELLSKDAAYRALIFGHRKAFSVA
jgi:hypothetical protein